MPLLLDTSSFSSYPRQVDVLHGPSGPHIIGVCYSLMSGFAFQVRTESLKAKIEVKCIHFSWISVKFLPFWGSVRPFRL